MRRALQVSRCVFEANTADGSGGQNGGGIDNYIASPVIVDCVFQGNFARSGGGGIQNSDGFGTIRRCVFVQNSTPNAGGGISNSSTASPLITDFVFIGNTAGLNGGGITNNDTTNPTILNCSFVANEAGSGGGIRNRQQSANATVVNCILWNNTPDQFSGFNLNATYADIQGGLAGTGNISSDPLFVDADGTDDVFGTPDDDLRLSSNSPCIDAADNSAVTGLTDLDGNPRIVDGDGDDVPVVDMGAYEFQLAASIPTVFLWGMVAMTRLMLAVGTLTFRRERIGSSS